MRQESPPIQTEVTELTGFNLVAGARFELTTFRL